uniref:Nicotinamide N-methyltransferase n=1 Tax=Leptobrachium leishanense TaxID=445787 RepID=A0A8C5PZ54_9ANUR
METPFTKQETYIRDFDPKEYFDTYYAPRKGAFVGEWTLFVLKNLHELFSSGEVKGDTIIDIGAGPTIYHLLSACEVFKNIITSDFLEQNREQLKKWLRKDPDMFDWSKIVQTVCDLEGNSEKCAEKEEKLRRAVRNVLKCDALKKNPFEPLVLPPADCVISCLCLEAPCKDADAYCNSVKNFKTLLKPGGHIIIQSVIGCTYYYIGKKRFCSLTVTKEDLKRAFTEGGYEILKLELKEREDMALTSICDHQGFYFVHARKLGNL